MTNIKLYDIKSPISQLQHLSHPLYCMPQQLVLRNGSSCPKNAESPNFLFEYAAELHVTILISVPIFGMFPDRQGMRLVKKNCIK